MKRTMFLVAAALLVMTALPAGATTTYGGTIETPCSTITVTGDGYQPGTRVEIDRNFDGEGCAGVTPPVPDDVDTTLTEEMFDEESGVAENVVESSSTLSEARVAEDGSFSVQVTVPTTGVDSYDFTVRGTDLSGEAKEQVYTYGTAPASAFLPVPAESSTARDTTLIAMAALMAAFILVVGFNFPALMARRRR